MTVITLKNKNYQSTLTAPFDIDLGGMIPLSTTTLSSTSSSITFSNIPGYYEHLQIRGIGRSTQAADGTNYIYLKFNGTTSQTTYSYHDMTGNGSSASAGGAADSTFIIAGQLPRANLLANSFSAQIIDILDYSNTNKNKTVRTLTGVDYNGLSNSQPGYIRLQSGLWRDTSAITSIELTPESSNFTQYSSFTLYGIKRAGA